MHMILLCTYYFDSNSIFGISQHTTGQLLHSTVYALCCVLTGDDYDMAYRFPAWALSACLLSGWSGAPSLLSSSP